MDKNDITLEEVNKAIAINAFALALKAVGDTNALKLEIVNLISECTSEPVSEVINRLDRKSIELMKDQLNKLEIRSGIVFDKLSDLLEKLI
jgi:hypothetical protein